MQNQTITFTFNVTLHESLELLSHLHAIRNQELPAPEKGPTTVINQIQAPAQQTIPVAAVVAPEYQPPQAHAPVPCQPAPAPAWQPPQAPLAAQPQPVQPQQGMPPQWQQQQPVAPVPTSAPTFTLEQLSIAAAPIMDAGRGAELTAMLGLFGVTSLGQIPPERYPDVALNLRAMGAAI